jgi:hypothetical protein
MNLGELKTHLDDLLARTDYTDSKKTTHINRALRRIQTATQLPDMEKTVALTLDSDLSADIPSDFRGTRHMVITDGLVPCEKIDLNLAHDYQLVRPPLNPRPYYRLMDKWYFPVADEGEEVTLVYYAAWDALAADADYNELTVLAPEAVIYGAASYACTYFMDNRVQQMEERFQAEVDELDLQIWNEEISSGSAQAIEPFQDPAAYPGGY